MYHVNIWQKMPTGGMWVRAYSCKTPEEITAFTRKGVSDATIGKLRLIAQQILFGNSRPYTADGHTFKVQVYP